MSVTPGAREGGHFSQAPRPNMPTDGNRTGRSILARATSAIAQVFVPRSDWLGPQMPIAPQAPDNVAGRQWDFTPGYNLLTTPRQEELFTFDQLRALAQYDVISGLVQRRIDQIRDLDWQIRGKSTLGSQTPISRDDDRVKKVQKFFMNPSPGVRWTDFIGSLLKDVLEIDAPCCYIRKNRGGELYSLDIMDGSLITPKIGSDGRMPIPPAPAYQQILHGLPAVNYTHDELIYKPRNPSSYKVYGKSPVEVIALTINMAMRRGVSQLDFFSVGSIPDGFITAPEGWTQSQIETLQSWFDSVLSGNLARRRRLTVVPAGATFHEWKQAPLKDDFDEWLVRIACFAFAYPPTDFTKTSNRATAGVAQETATDEGREPLKKWLKELIDLMIERGFGYDDIEFSWIDKRTVKPEDQAKIDVGDITAGIRTRQEVRVSRGLDPVEGADVLTVTTGQGIFPVTHIEDLSNAQIVHGPVNADNLVVGNSGGQPTPVSVAGPKGNPLGGTSSGVSGVAAAKPARSKKATPEGGAAKDKKPARKLYATGSLASDEVMHAALAKAAEPVEEAPMTGAGDDHRRMTLCILRPLRNVGDFAEWARAAGFESMLADPHVTVTFSRAPVDWETVTKPSKVLIVKGGTRSIERFGGNAAVLRFESGNLAARWQELRAAGASHSYPEFQPHVAISWDSPPELDLTLIAPYAGDLVFGPEEFYEVDEGVGGAQREEAAL